VVNFVASLGLDPLPLAQPSFAKGEKSFPNRKLWGQVLPGWKQFKTLKINN
jgi:hypothetical protein